MARSVAKLTVAVDAVEAVEPLLDAAAHDAQVMPVEVEVDVGRRRAVGVGRGSPMRGRHQLCTSRSMAWLASVTRRSASSAAPGDGVGDAVPQVLVEQGDGHALERLGRRGDLGEDVDAVGVLVDHPLEAAHLALDAAQPLEDVVLGVVVAGRRAHGDTLPQ